MSDAVPPAVVIPGQHECSDVETQTCSQKVINLHFSQPWHLKGTQETWDYSCAMVIEGTIVGKSVPMLVDTGSVSTLISKKVFDQLIPKPELRPCPRHHLADGSDLKTYGMCELEISFDGKMFQANVVVADLATQCILGYKFLRQWNFVWDWEKQTLVNGVNTKSCINRFVKVTHEVIVPAESEMIIDGTVSGMGPFAEGLICGIPTAVGTYGIMVAAAVVKNRNVPLRVMNVQREPCKLDKGTILAEWEPLQIIPSSAQSSEGDSKTVLPEYLLDLYQRSSVSLNDDQAQQLKNLLINYQDVFAKPGGPLGRTDLVEHAIDTGDARPVKLPPRRIPLAKQKVAQQEVAKMLEQGVIEPSFSPWAAPIVLVTKRDQTIRYCIDFRKLNELTVKDAYPLPRIEDNLDALSGSEWYSTLDMASGYWQVAMKPEDKEKTAFSTGTGHYQFTVMPFGLCNAPSTFERLMERVLAGLQWHSVVLYIDDVIVFGKTFAEHVARLEEVLSRLRKTNLRLKPKKCELFQKEVAFLGHLVSKEGVKTQPAKVQTVQTWPTPNSVHQVRQFLGLTSYYRKFIQDYAEIAKPLHALTEKGRDWYWTEECQVAFENLKEALVTAPILAYPSQDGRFILDTDASNVAIGAVLSQIQDGHERVLAYGSRILSSSERNYSVTKREALAVIYFVKHFHHYLYGRKFLLRTDHGSLRWLFNFKQIEGQIARWIQILGTYDFEIEHRPGRKHGNADAMSRLESSDLVEVCDQRSVESSDSHHLGALAQSDDEESVGVNPFAQENLRLAQLDDPILGLLLKAKESDSPIPDWSLVAPMGSTSKMWWNSWDLLVVHEGVLYRKWEYPEVGGSYWRVAVPSNLIPEVLKQLHSNITSGHFAYDRTWKRARTSKFYWPGMRKSVQDYCAKCFTCDKARNPTPRPRSALQQERVGVPLERMAADILSMPETERGNRYLLVVGDYFTKWTEAIPLMDQEAETIAQAFMDRIFSVVGIPKIIHTDQGKNFDSILFKELCRMLGIEKTRTTAFRPQSDGMIERMNRTIIAMLKSFATDCQLQWDMYISGLMLAYRSSVHSSTGQTPNLMMFGREFNMPVDLMLGRFPGQREVSNVPEYVADMRTALEDSHEHARKHLQTAMKRQKVQYDKKVSGNAYKTGDGVWLLDKRLKQKLSDSCTGPYVILEKVGSTLYKIARGRARPKIVHFDLLKKCNTELDQALVDLARNYVPPDVPPPPSGTSGAEVASSNKSAPSGDLGPRSRAGRPLKKPKRYSDAGSLLRQVTPAEMERRLPHQCIQEVDHGERRFWCMLCECQFKQRSKAMRHVQGRHLEFLSRRTLHYCPIDGMAYTRHGRLRDHYLRQHPGEAVPPARDTGVFVAVGDPSPQPVSTVALASDPEDWSDDIREMSSIPVSHVTIPGPFPAEVASGENLVPAASELWSAEPQGVLSQHNQVVRQRQQEARRRRRQRQRQRRRTGISGVESGRLLFGDDSDSSFEGFMGGLPTDTPAVSWTSEPVVASDWYAASRESLAAAPTQPEWVPIRRPSLATEAVQQNASAVSSVSGSAHVSREAVVASPGPFFTVAERPLEEDVRQEQIVCRDTVVVLPRLESPLLRDFPLSTGRLAAEVGSTQVPHVPRVAALNRESTPHVPGMTPGIPRLPVETVVAIFPNVWTDVKSEVGLSYQIPLQACEGLSRHTLSLPAGTLLEFNGRVCVLPQALEVANVPVAASMSNLCAMYESWRLDQAEHSSTEVDLNQSLECSVE